MGLSRWRDKSEESESVNWHLGERGGESDIEKLLHALESTTFLSPNSLLMNVRPTKEVEL